MSGKQQEAPGRLELVRAFVNSADIEQGTDRLDGPQGLAQWLREHELLDGSTAVATAELERAIALREALRAVLLAHNDGATLDAAVASTLDAAALRGRLRLRFPAAGAPTLIPEVHGVDGALGQMLAIVHDSIARGTWDKLKACRLHTCEWAFYDHSKNRSGVWCNMDVCGNRAKARAFRERRAPRLSP
jgi:predicted RNA-binding Zn ribbon-like protein